MRATTSGKAGRVMARAPGCRGAARCAPTYYESNHRRPNARPPAHDRSRLARGLWQRPVPHLQRRRRLAHRAPARQHARQVQDSGRERRRQGDAGRGLDQRGDPGSGQRRAVTLVEGRALLGISLWVLASACEPSDPCRSSRMHLRTRYAARYIGHWVVAHGDTLTLPQMGDRFKLTNVVLDTARVAVGRDCHFRGTLVFQVPRAETLAVTWLGAPEQALIYGLPAELRPFGGIGALPVGGSLAWGILVHQPRGVQGRPGVTAPLIARRGGEGANPLSWPGS